MPLRPGGCEEDADLAVLEAGSLEVADVVGGGRRLVREGAVVENEPGATARGQT